MIVQLLKQALPLIFSMHTINFEIDMSQLMQTHKILLHVGQGFSLALSNPEGLPYK